MSLEKRRRPQQEPQAGRVEHAGHTIDPATWECTILIDGVGPTVTVSVLETALNQFGRVLNVVFCFEELDPSRSLGSALVQLATPNEAKRVVEEFQEKLFCLGGTPRPVIAYPATRQMLEETAAIGGGGESSGPFQPLPVQLLSETDAGAEEAWEWWSLAYRQRQERDELQKHFENEAKKLAQQQEELLKDHSQKLDLILQASRNDGLKNVVHALGLPPHMLRGE